MDAKFSPRVRAILSLSHQEAQRLGNAYVGLEHLFLGMLKEGGSSAIKILENLNLNIEVFSKKLEASVRTANSNQNSVLALPLTKQAERVLKFTYIIAKEFHSDIVRSEHLMLAILHESRKTLNLKASTMITSSRNYCASRPKTATHRNRRPKSNKATLPTSSMMMRRKKTT